MNDRQQRELARRLVNVERALAGLSAQQLNRSSLENGSIKEYDADGVLSSIIGQQFDGAHGVQVIAGPMPPRPGVPTVSPVIGGLRIEYLATDADDRPMVVPTDFLRFEVHIGNTATGLGTNTIPKTTIESARGGVVTPLVDLKTDCYVAIVTVTTPGRRSTPSDVVGPVRALEATAEDLDVDFEQLRGTKVFYGPTQPVTTKADLWLKEPENVAYRYDPGTSTWIKMQDQGIVKALQDAKTAGDAANQAGLDALAAQTTASTKTTTFRQVSAPSTTGRTVGDTWYDTDDHNRIYTWNGTAWATTPLGVGALLVTARELGAITTYRQASPPSAGLILGDFWIDSDDNVLYRWEGAVSPAWAKVQDVNIETAITNAATAQATADGKMRIFPQTSAPTGLGAGDVGDLWIDTDDGNKSYTWTGTAWQARLLGNSSIEPKSLVASNVVATGTVTAALLEATMVLTNTVIAGPPLGDHARLTPTGVFAYAADPIDGVPDEVARFGRTSGGRDPATGRLSWQVDEKGIATFQRVMSADSDPAFGGTSLAQRDWERPWGLVGYVSVPPFEPPAFTPATPTELGICELAFDAVPGREYKLVHDAFELSTDYRFSNVNLGDRGTAMIRVRRTTNGTVPYTDTADMPVERMVGDVKSDYSDEVSGSYLLGGPTAPARNPGENFAAWQTRIGKVRWRLLVSFGPAPAYNADNSSTGIRWIRMGRFTPARVWIEDVGPQRPNIGRLTDGLRPTGQTPPPPPPAKITRTVDYPVTWSGSWPQSNNWTSSHRAGWIYQGKSDGYDSYGAQMGAWGWDQGAVRNDLQGAEINRVEIYMFAYHWHWAGGGTARIGWNRGTGTGGSFPGNFEWFDRNFGRGHGQWIDITGWGWRLAMPAGHTDNMTGIGVGVGGDHNLQYYGYFAGLGDVAGRYPALRVTFTK